MLQLLVSLFLESYVATTLCLYGLVTCSTKNTTDFVGLKILGFVATIMSGDILTSQQKCYLFCCLKHSCVNCPEVSLQHPVVSHSLKAAWQSPPPVTPQPPPPPRDVKVRSVM